MGPITGNGQPLNYFRPYYIFPLTYYALRCTLFHMTHEHTLIRWTSFMQVCSECGELVRDPEPPKPAKTMTDAQRRGWDWVLSDVFGHTFDGKY